MNFPAAGTRGFANLLFSRPFPCWHGACKQDHEATAWESWWHDAKDGAARESGTGLERGEQDDG